MIKKVNYNKELSSHVHWLPNLLTTASLFSAFYAMIITLIGNFDSAATAIFIAMIFDTLDGRVARLTNSVTEFGAQYDSIADVVGFGVAPAILMYQFALYELSRLGWLVTFVYLVCTALRLARFNIKKNIIDKKFFQGLPCPSAAAIIVSCVWLLHKYQIEHNWLLLTVLLGITIWVSILMVSNIGYYSFKDFSFNNKSPYVIGFLNAAIIILVALNPPVVLFIVFFSYSISGSVYTLVKKRQLIRQRKKSGTNSDKIL